MPAIRWHFFIPKIKGKKNSGNCRYFFYPLQIDYL